MRLTVYFKTVSPMHFDGVERFAVNDIVGLILRIDMIDGRTHFINFNEVIACVEEKSEEEKTE